MGCLFSHRRHEFVEDEEERHKDKAQSTLLYTQCRSGELAVLMALNLKQISTVCKFTLIHLPLDWKAGSRSRQKTPNKNKQK